MVKDAIGKWLQAFPDMSAAVHEIVAEGDIVVARYTSQGTHKGPLMGTAATGKKVTFRGVDMIRVKNGKATEVWHEGDDALVLMQLGVQIPGATQPPNVVG